MFQSTAGPMTGRHSGQAHDNLTDVAFRVHTAEARDEFRRHQAWYGNLRTAALQSAAASVAQPRFNLSRSESALRRYRSAVRTLATVRTLAPRGLLPVHRLRPCDPDRWNGLTAVLG